MLAETERAERRVASILDQVADEHLTMDAEFRIRSVNAAACRALGLAARYVSGYLLTRPLPGQPKLVGADASHAWVELWCPEQGWLALDPTNDVPANLDHVTLAWGRDYADVAPLRGVLRGGGVATLRVGVTVEPAAADALARSAEQQQQQ